MKKDLTETLIDLKKKLVFTLDPLCSRLLAQTKESICQTFKNGPLKERFQVCLFFKVKLNVSDSRSV